MLSIINIDSFSRIQSVYLDQNKQKSIYNKLLLAVFSFFF